MCDKRTLNEYINQQLIADVNRKHHQQQQRMLALNEVKHYHSFVGFACSKCGITMRQYMSTLSADRQICPGCPYELQE